ncbi:MAG: nitroreductase family protein, partial [Bacteroidales bacterium]|nr:nitroreductase family protein [Bacteroidales bacterium]
MLPLRTAAFLQGMPCRGIRLHAQFLCAGPAMLERNTELMNEVIRHLLEKRTIRHYKEEQIKEDDLKWILQAGLYASTAGGRQSPVMLV